MSSKSKTILISLPILCIIIALGLYISKKVNPSSFLSATSAESVSNTLPDNTLKVKEGVSTPISLQNSYKDENFPLSFKHPSNLHISSFAEGDNYIILAASDEPNQGFQIVISPYDGGEPITRALLEIALPEMKILEPQELIISGNTRTLAFQSDNPAFDKASYEIWFSYGNFLYQMSAYQNQSAVLKAVAKSIGF